MYSRRQTANAVCARWQGLASCDELERNFHDNSTGVLGAGTYAQPKQASHSKYYGKIRLHSSPLFTNFDLFIEDNCTRGDVFNKCPLTRDCKISFSRPIPIRRSDK